MKVSTLIAWVVAVTVVPLRVAADFSLPQPNPAFHFPQDHGSHPDFKLEWWYVTGHLTGETGNRYGFQATFFRHVSTEVAAAPATVYLAHMALLDVGKGNFIYQTRLNRNGWDASAAVGHLAVENGPWSLRMDRDSEAMVLKGGIRSQVKFDLRLTPEKPVVLFGENGFSRKGAEASAASYYLTFTRLKTVGTLRVDGLDLRVEGLSWMDHEISSSQLGAGLVGWDWVCIQLLDGREIMMYRLRRADGTSDPVSSLTWVDQAAKTQLQPFEWRPLATWKSPETGGRYPSRVELKTSDPANGGKRVFVLEPLAENQELAAGPGGIAYWEGACRVRDGVGKEIGSAYLELTGYAKPLKFCAGGQVRPRIPRKSDFLFRGFRVFRGQNGSDGVPTEHTETTEETDPEFCGKRFPTFAFSCFRTFCGPLLQERDLRCAVWNVGQLRVVQESERVGGVQREYGDLGFLHREKSPPGAAADLESDSVATTNAARAVRGGIAFQQLDQPGPEVDRPSFQQPSGLGISQRRKTHREPGRRAERCIHFLNPAGTLLDKDVKGRDVRLDVKNRRSIHQVAGAQKKIQTLDPQELHRGQTERIRPMRRARCENASPLSGTARRKNHGAPSGVAVKPPEQPNAGETSKVMERFAVSTFR